MKRCKYCGEEKAMSDFYPASSGCRVCTRAKVRANRLARVDFYKAADRVRANDPKRVEARKVYASSPQGRAKIAEGSKRWAKRNPEKRRAQVLLNNAVRDGRMLRKSCGKCDCQSAQAHHDDYSKPLDVRWLCTVCHAQEHKTARHAADFHSGQHS